MCLRWMPSLKPLKEHVKIYLDTKERKEERKERNRLFQIPPPKKKNPEMTAHDSNKNLWEEKIWLRN